VLTKSEMDLSNQLVFTKIVEVQGENAFGEAIL